LRLSVSGTLKNIRTVLVPFLAVIWFVGGPDTAGCAGNAAFELSIIQESGRAQKVLYRIHIRPGENFRIAYTHSLEKCPIYEVFRVEEDASITQIEEVYGWFAAGLEANPDTGFTDVGDHMVHIRGLEKNLKEIPIRVGWICNFRVEVRKEAIPLISLAPPGKLLWIRIIGNPNNE